MTLEEKIKSLFELHDCALCIGAKKDGTHAGFSRQHYDEIYGAKIRFFIESDK